MLPHPVLATEDDAQYITRTLLSLPELMRRLFECLDAVYTRADGGENNYLASSLYFTIRNHLSVLAMVPADAFRMLDVGFGDAVPQEFISGRQNPDTAGAVMLPAGTMVPGPALMEGGSGDMKKPEKYDKELPKLIQSLHRLFAEDMMKVGPKALSWKKKCMGLANECADHMRLASVRLPRRNRFHRQVISPSKVVYGLLLLFFFLSVLLAMLIMIAIPAINPPGRVGLLLGIPAVVFLLATSIAMGFYYIKATTALQRLYRQVFLDMMMMHGGAGGMSSPAAAQGTMAPYSFRSGSGAITGCSSPVNNSGPFLPKGVDGPGRLLDPTGSTRLRSKADGGLRLGAASITCLPGAVAPAGGAAMQGYFAISYLEDMGYIDGRMLDAQVVMIAYDANYHITRWNNAAEVLTGFLGEGCVGKPLDELVQTPSGQSIVEEIKRGRKNRLLKVKLCALVTPPNILHTVVAPIVSANHETVGHMLICANTSDNLRHYRIYLQHYVGIQAQETLTRICTRPTLLREDSVFLTSLRHFIQNATPSHIDELARDMSAEWEWTNADQLLGRAFGETLSQHTRMIDPLFPPTICVSPMAAKALGLCVRQCGPSMLHLTVTNLRGTVFALSVSITPKKLSGSASTSGVVSVRSSINTGALTAVEPSPSIPQTPGSRHSRRGMTGSAGSHRGSTSVLLPINEFSRIEESISSLLLAAAGSISLVEDRMILTFPCQVAPIIDDVEDDDAEAQQMAQARHIINCNVNVVTMINNMVDQHNLSLSLLKTMFVSIATVRDRADLEKRLSAQPCEVDVIICDGEWLSSCRDLLFSGNHSAIVIPLLAHDTPIGNTLCKHTIRVPVVSRAVQEVMLDVGRTVSARKNAISAQEEREHILTLRQDSPWTKGKLLGRGSQGAVYEATSDLTGGKMAVKVFYFTSGSSEGSINRLLNEIKIMCSLNHPNIVHYFHSERTEAGVHLFMELCDGSLTDVIVRRMKKPDHLGVLPIVRQLLRCPPLFMDQATLLGDMTSATPYLKNLPDNPILLDFLRRCFEMAPERRATSAELLSHQLLRIDTACSDVEAHSVFNAPLRHEEQEANFSIMSTI
eukprot:gene3919-2787_t